MATARREIRIQALLDAFFTNCGEGKPRGGEKGHLTTADLREKLPALEDDLHGEQDRLYRVAREEARRADARAQRRAVHRRQVDPDNLRADEGRA